MDDKPVTQKQVGIVALIVGAGIAVMWVIGLLASSFCFDHC